MDIGRVRNLRVGNSINDISITEVVIERVYCVISKPSDCVNCSVDMWEDLYEWCFVIGIYKSCDKYYLWLESNDKSWFCEDMYSEDLFPNCGFMQISKNEAKYIADFLNELGKESFKYSISNFNQLIRMFASIIPCKISFVPLVSKGGFYNKVDKSITIANNQCHYNILFAIVHEYVHFLIDSNPRKNRMTIGQYVQDEEECICNAVAFDLLKEVIIDYDSFYDPIMTEIIQLDQLIMCNDERDVERILIQVEGFSPETKTIFSALAAELQLREKPSIQKKVNELTEGIANRIKKALDDPMLVAKEPESECVQSGLVVLNDVDNFKLYQFIMNQISPMLSPDNYDY